MSHERSSFLQSSTFSGNHAKEKGKETWNVKLISKFTFTVNWLWKENSELIWNSARAKIMKKIRSPDIWSEKLSTPPKSIIDYSTFYLLFLLISWNISSGCQDALFEHSTCAPILSHEILVLVWMSIDSLRRLKALSPFSASTWFLLPRFNILLFTWTSNQRGRHSKTFQNFLPLLKNKGR